MKACCSDFCMVNPDDRGNNHHKNCDGYKTEKFPYLFYYEDAVDAWVPVPAEIAMIISTTSLDDKEKISIEFKRIDLTDEEYAAIPED